MLFKILSALFGSRPKTRHVSKTVPSRKKTAVHRPRPKPKSKPPEPAQSHDINSPITGKCYVVDGDTINIGKHCLRLYGIDAPELDHPWGQKAKWHLVNLCKGQTITAKLDPSTSYERLVATCYLPDGRDLSAEMVRAGHALDWPKYSQKKYAALEPTDIRKRHWKAAARQRGDMQAFNK